MKFLSLFRSLCLILFVFLTFAGRIVADDVPDALVFGRDSLRAVRLITRGVPRYFCISGFPDSLAVAILTTIPSARPSDGFAIT
jgi:hypothetical protein